MFFARIRNFITIKATSNYNRCKISYNHNLSKLQFNLKTTTLNYSRIKAQAFYYLMPYDEWLFQDTYVDINYVQEGYVSI